MRIALIADPHFVSDDDECEFAKQTRAFFKDAWPSFQALTKLIKNEAPDLTILLGDLVDWYSAPNRDFGLEMMSDLGDWQMAPGNHDSQLWIPDEQGKPRPARNEETDAIAARGWKERNIDLNNRTVDAGDYRLILLDSAKSNVPAGTQEWLRSTLTADKKNLIFTHVPLAIDPVRTFIHDVDPHRDLGKYVQSGAPWLFEDYFKSNAQAVFSGHLHFPGELTVERTTLHMLPQAITSLQPGALPAGGMILDLLPDNMSIRNISL